MKLAGKGSKGQFVLLGVLALVLAGFIVSSKSKSPEPAARIASPAADASGDGPRAGGRRAPAALTADEVPLLQPEDLGPRSHRGSAATDRDLFDLREPTRRPPPTPTPGPPPPPAPGQAEFVGPPPPPPPTPTPAPPAIPFKFIGSFGPRERPIVVLVAGDKMVNARAGDVVFEHFILRKVGYESIDVGFLGFADSFSKRLGIEK